MAIYATLFDGTILEFPDGTKDEVIDRVAKQETLAKRPPEEPKVEEKKSTKTSFFEDIVTDPLAALVGGAGKSISSPFQLQEIIGGKRPEKAKGTAEALIESVLPFGSKPAEMPEKVLEKVIPGATRPEVSAPELLQERLLSAVNPLAPLQPLAKELEATGEKLESEGLKEQKKQLAEAVGKEEGLLAEAGAAVGGTLTSPKLLSNFIFQQIPNLMLSMGGGAVTKEVAKSALKNAAEKTIERIGVSGAVATGAAMQGADVGSDVYKTVYDGLKAQGLSEEEAHKIAIEKAQVATAEASAISVIANMLPGARALEEKFLTKGIQESIKKDLGKKAAIRAVAGETVGETFEEGAGKLAGNIEVAKALPGTDIYKGVGEAAGMGALGGAMFGGAANISPTEVAADIKAKRDAKKVAEEVKATPTPEAEVAPKAQEKGRFVMEDGVLVDKSKELPKEEAAPREPISDLRTLPEEDKKRIVEINREYADIQRQKLDETKPLSEEQQVTLTSREDALVDELEKITGNRYEKPAVESFKPKSKVEITKQPIVQEFYDEAMSLADKVEKAGQKGFADAVRLNAERGKFQTSEDLDFYRERVKDFEQQAIPTEEKPKQTFNIENYLKGYPADQKRYQELTKSPEEVQKVVVKASDYIQKLTDAINDLGWKVEDINVTSPKELQDLQKKISEIAGSATSFMKKAEAITKQYKRADPKKYESLINELEQDFATANTMISAPRNIQGNSWVIREKDTGKVITETFDPAKVIALNKEKYEAVPAGKYLGEVNQQIKEKGDINYREASEDQKGISKDLLEKIAADVTKGWVNAPKIKSVQSITELPQNIQDQIARDNVQRVQGVFDPATQQVFLVADNIPNAQQAVMTVAHETVGHFGLRSILGADYGKTMRSMYENAEVKKRADEKIEAGMGKELATEEVLAEMAESKENPTVIQRMINILRAALKKLGLNIKGVTNGEIRQLLADSRQYVIEGKGEAKLTEAPTEPTFRVEGEPTKEAEQNKKYREEFDYKGKEPSTNWFKKKYNEIKEGLDSNMNIGTVLFGNLQNFASFDQAYNNRIRKYMLDLAKNGDVTMEQARQALLRISTSQAVHRANLANQIMDKGNYKYDDVVNRWYAVEDDINMLKFEELAKTMAKRLNISEQQALEDMSAGYEANRLNSILKSYENAKAESNNLSDRFDELSAKENPTAEEVMELEDLPAKMADNFESLQGYLGQMRHKGEDLVEISKKIEAGMKLYNANPEIKEGTEIWNTMRDRVVTMMVDTGLMTKKKAKQWLDEAAYVPFFRDMGEMKAASKNPRLLLGGLKETMAPLRREFKGSELRVQNTVGNMFSWMQWAISASVSNKQQQVMIQQYMSVLPEEVRRGKGPEGNTFSIMEKGVQKFYTVADPSLARAFTHMAPQIFPLIGAFKFASNIMRHNVTRNPVFPIAQIFLDAQAVMFTSGLKSPFKLIKEITKEIAKTTAGTSEAREKLKSAGILETDYNALNEADAVGERLGLTGEDGKVKRNWKLLMRSLDRFASAADNVIRQGVYEQAIKEGRSEVEALELATEIVNFRRQSGFERVQAFSQTVPFFNAWTQVSAVTMKTLSGKGITPQTRKQGLITLASTSAKMAALSFIYAAAMGDDEEYKKKNRMIRDRLWMIPGTGMGIPLRLDAFSLPKIIGEYTYHALVGKVYVDSKMVTSAFAEVFWNTISPPSEGIPQLIRTPLELKLNKDIFRDRDIVPPALAKLESFQQYDKNTSEAAKVIGKMTNSSPMKIDHFLKGWFASTATITAILTDDAIAKMRGVERPDQSMRERLSKVPTLGAAIGSEKNTAIVSDFWDVYKDSDKIISTYKNLLVKGETEEAEKYLKENRDKVVYTTGIKNALDNLKQKENMIIGRADISGAEKARLLKEIEEARASLHPTVLEMRKYLYKK